MGCCIDVKKFANLGKLDSGAGGTCGNEWKIVKANDLVHFAGTFLRDGVLGGSDGAIFRRHKDGACRHDEIDKCMTFSRLSVKSNEP